MLGDMLYHYKPGVFQMVPHTTELIITENSSTVSLIFCLLSQVYESCIVFFTHIMIIFCTLNFEPEPTLFI